MIPFTNPTLSYTQCSDALDFHLSHAKCHFSVTLFKSSSKQGPQTEFGQYDSYAFFFFFFLIPFTCWSNWHLFCRKSHIMNFAFLWFHLVCSFVLCSFKLVSKSLWTQVWGFFKIHLMCFSPLQSLCPDFYIHIVSSLGHWETPSSWCPCPFGKTPLVLIASLLSGTRCPSLVLYGFLPQTWKHSFLQGALWATF